MKSCLLYLACFLVAILIVLPTVVIIKLQDDQLKKEIRVIETTRQVIYAPEPIEEVVEKKVYPEFFIRNPYKVFEADIEQICDIEADETEEEYLSPPEREFESFTTYVYNGMRKKLPASVNLQRIVHETAENYDLPYRIVLAMLGIETTWNEDPDHVETNDGVRYIGIGCINERYHAKNLANKGIDIYTLEGNIEGLCWLLRAQLDRFGNVNLALMAYNGGGGYVQWATERGIYENNYSITVTRYAESFE